MAKSSPPDPSSKVSKSSSSPTASGSKTKEATSSQKAAGGGREPDQEKYSFEKTASVGNRGSATRLADFDFNAPPLQAREGTYVPRDRNAVGFEPDGLLTIGGFNYGTATRDPGATSGMLLRQDAMGFSPSRAGVSVLSAGLGVNPVVGAIGQEVLERVGALPDDWRTLGGISSGTRKSKEDYAYESDASDKSERNKSNVIKPTTASPTPTSQTPGQAAMNQFMFSAMPIFQYLDPNFGATLQKHIPAAPQLEMPTLSTTIGKK